MSKWSSSTKHGKIAVVVRGSYTLIHVTRLNASVIAMCIRVWYMHTKEG